jgi:hypothetical protein
MFKIGDKVVCINSKNIIYWEGDIELLIKNKVYKIIYVTSYYEKGKYAISLDGCRYYRWNPDRFILINDYRKQKLKKLCSK